MMSVKKVLHVLLFCLLSVLVIQAQDKAWQDLQHLGEKYSHSTNMHYDATLKMYTSIQPVKVIDQLHAVCQMDAENYYAQVGAVELIRNKRCLVTIDHDEKMVLLASADNSGQNKLAAMLTDMSKLMDMVKEGGTRIQKVLRGNETWLELSELPDNGVLACNIQYDPGTFLIKRIWMKAMDETQSAVDPVIVDIRYRYDGKAPGTEHFNEKKFVLVEGKKAVLQPAYQHYTLINQL